VSLRTYFRLFTHTQLLPVLESGEETLVGGQAVMEGVMMRAPHSYCVAVRKPNGEIVTEQQPLAKISEKYPIFKLPVLRGVGTLYQAMSLGMKALKFSADVSMDEIKKQEKAKNPKAKEVPGWVMAGNLIFSLAMFIFMYKFIPLYLVTWVKGFYPVLNEEYAMQIAREWNVKASGAGFVTRFKVKTAFISRYPTQVVGGRIHAELWVPADELEEFNRHIVGSIEVIAEFRPS